MVREGHDPFGEGRTLRTRWFDLTLKLTGFIMRRRVWIALWLVFLALSILGVIVMASRDEPLPL